MGEEGFADLDCFFSVAGFFVGLGEAEGDSATIPTECFVGAIGDTCEGFFEPFDSFDFVASYETWHIE